MASKCESKAPDEEPFLRSDEGLENLVSLSSWCKPFSTKFAVIHTAAIILNVILAATLIFFIQSRGYYQDSQGTLALLTADVDTNRASIRFSERCIPVQEDNVHSIF
jgi:hypothetical protein